MKPYSVIIMAMLLLIPTITRCGSNKHNEHAEQDSTVTVRAKETAQHENEGDTLCEYDGNTVIYKLLEDIQSLSFSEITTYAGNKTISKCKVKGYSNLVSVHGMMNEFYLTFDNKDGRVLGYRDILGDEGMSKAIPVMNKKLDKRLINDTEVSGGHSSDLGKVGKDDYYDRMLNETFEGYVYPRAAITRNGIVFTYQPYDKGSFADGVLHILLNRP